MDERDDQHWLVRLAGGAERSGLFCNVAAMRWGMKAVAALGAMLACAVYWAPSAVAAPGNDDFSDREVLSGPLPIAASGSNVEATKEDGEPFLAFGKGRTIWYEWEAESTSFTTVGTCGTDIRTQVGVYTGTALNGLTPVADGFSGGPGCPSSLSGSQATFKAEAGAVYVILVDGDAFYLPPSPPPSGEGPISLQVEATPPPPNDDFAHAALLSGQVHEEPGGARIYFASGHGYNWAATKEPGEPSHGGDPGGASVWFSWTAPESGFAHMSACCGRPRLLGIYTGESIGTLTTVASGIGFAEVSIVAGSTYRIAVDGMFDPEAGVPAVGGFSVGVSIVLPSGPGWRTFPIEMPPALDRTAPTTTINRSKVMPRKRWATFRFSSNEPGIFKCSLDGRPYVICSSPRTYMGLQARRHTFEVVATDAAGNIDASPATASFRISKPKPRKAKD